VEGAGVQVEALVFCPLAAAESVLEDEEKEQGVILVDIGGGTTDIAVFMEGAVFHTTVLPVGGYHLTHDLVAGLRAPYSTVEEIKLNHGSCMPSRVDAEEIIDIDSFGGQRTKEVPRRRIAEILQARVEEILEMIYIDVKRAGFDDMVAAGLVITGGTAGIPGIVELSELVLRMPVRTGVPRRIHGLADSLNSPAYATSVGLLQWAAAEAAPSGNGRRPNIKLPNVNVNVNGFIGAAGRWLKTLIPR
jgi:cell division protein FtsA